MWPCYVGDGLILQVLAGSVHLSTGAEGLDNRLGDVRSWRLEKVQLRIVNAFYITAFLLFFMSHCSLRESMVAVLEFQQLEWFFGFTKYFLKFKKYKYFLNVYLQSVTSSPSQTLELSTNVS